MNCRISSCFFAVAAAALVLCTLSLCTAQAGLPVIVSLTRDQAPKLDDRVVLETVVVADPPATLGWLHSGKVVGQGPQLNLNSITLADLGSYQVIAQNTSGSVTSAPVFLAARPQRFTLTESPHSIQRTTGSQASFIVLAESEESITYQWWGGNQAIVGGTAAVLRIPNINAADVGDYRVVVSSGSLSITSRTAQLTLASSPVSPTNYVLVGGFTLTNPVIAPLFTTNPTRYFGIASLAADGTLIHTDPNRQSSLPKNPEPDVIGFASLSPLSGYFWRTDGSIQAWGQTNLLSSKLPANIPGLRRLIFSYSEKGLGIPVYALTESGEVFRYTTDATSPTHGKVDALTGSTDLVVGNGFAVGLTAEGNVITARFKEQTSVTATTYAPFGSDSLPPGLGRIVSMDAALGTVIALREDGQLFQWTDAGVDRKASRMVLGGVKVGLLNNGWVVLREDGRLSAWHATPRFLTSYEGPSPWDLVGELEDVTDFAMRDRRCYALGRFTTPASSLISKHPQPQVSSVGSAVALSVESLSELSRFQWHLDDVDLPGATNAFLGLQSVRSDQAGSYSVTVSTPGGRVRSQPALLSVSPYAAALPLAWSSSGASDYAGDAAEDGSGNTYAVLGPAQLVKYGYNGQVDWAYDLSSLPNSPHPTNGVKKVAGDPSAGVYVAQLTGSSINRTSSVSQYAWARFSPQGGAPQVSTISVGHVIQGNLDSLQVLSLDAAPSGALRFLVKDQEADLRLVSATTGLPVLTDITSLPDSLPRISAFSSFGFIQVRSHPFTVLRVTNNLSGVIPENLTFPSLDTDTLVEKATLSRIGENAIAGSYGGSTVLTRQLGSLDGERAGFVGVLDKFGKPAWVLGRLPVQRFVGLAFRASGNLLVAATAPQEIVLDGVLFRSPTASQLILMEFTPQGNLRWVQSTPGDYGSDTKVLTSFDEGCVIVGGGQGLNAGILPAKAGLGSFAAKWVKSERAPKILRSPSGGTFEKGSSVALSFAATGDALTTQWFRNGVPIPGATQSALRFTNFGVDDAGAYEVRLSNPFGTELSPPVILSIGLRLVVDTSNGGTLVVSPVRDLHPLGSTARIDATPSVGYGFLNWGPEVSDRSNPLILILSNSVHLQPQFIPTPLVLTTIGNGTVSSVPSGTFFRAGTNVTLFAQPGLYHRLLGWTDGSQSTPRTITIGLTNNYTAVFTNILELETNTLNGVRYIGPKGTPVAVISGAPFFGRKFEASLPTTLDLVSTYKPTRIHYTLDGTLPTLASPIFTKRLTIKRGTVYPRAIAEALEGTTSYPSEALEIRVLAQVRLAVEGVDQGTTSVDQDGPYYLEGTTINLSATPINGWTFMGWLGDADGSRVPLPLTLQGDTSVTPVFGTQVQVFSTGSGSIRLEPLMNLYPAGTRVTLIPQPSAGWYFKDWSDSPGESTLRSYTVASASRSFQARFLPLPNGTVALVPQVVGDGVIEITPRLPYYSVGAHVHLHAVAGPHARFVGWAGEPSSSEHLSIVLGATKQYTAQFVTIPELNVVVTDSGQASGWRIEIHGYPGQRYEIYHRSVESLSSPVPWRFITRVSNPQGILHWPIPSSLRNDNSLFQVIPLPQ